MKRKKQEDRPAHGDALLAALGYLAQRERGIDEMAERLRIQRRTAYRLLQSLERAGFHVQVRREGARAYHHIPPASLRRGLGI